MDFKQELLEFKQHLADTTNLILDELDSDNQINLEKYDIVLVVNGKQIQIPCNADVYSSLDMIINDELDQY